MTKQQRNKNLADKVAYIFRQYGKNEVSKGFGFSNQSGLSGWDNPLNPKIRPIHLLGLQEYFQIPITIFNDDISYNELAIDRAIEEYKKHLQQQKKKQKIFESLEKHSLIPENIYNKEIETKEQIDKVIEEYKVAMLSSKDKTINNLFKKDERLWGKLKGDFYAYMYASEVFNGDQKIHQVKTTFYGDYQVIDQHDNEGKLFMGENQSIILKKTPNEKNFSFILFPNKQVSYQTFRFAIISIQNGTYGEEMFNWGFYSREKLSIREAQEVLGEKKKIQIKLNSDFLIRVRQKFKIE